MFLKKTNSKQNLFNFTKYCICKFSVNSVIYGKGTTLISNFYPTGSKLTGAYRGGREGLQCPFHFTLRGRGPKPEKKITDYIDGSVP